MGGKQRIVKEILPIILKNRKPAQYYVEPFVGGFNVIDKVDGPRIANDIHYYLIELYKAVQRGWVPPTRVSRDEYYSIKYNKDKYDPWLVGFVGFGCSFAARWFEGYARKIKGDDSSGFIKSGESCRSILKQYEGIQGVEIFNMDYTELLIPENSIIYCDPPYQGLKRYSGVSNFDHNTFWNWCRDRAGEGHNVFVSETWAPEDFVCVWEKQVSNEAIRSSKNKTRLERLFMLG
jgi:DNA adenine methylase